MACLGSTRRVGPRWAEGAGNVADGPARGAPDWDRAAGYLAGRAEDFEGLVDHHDWWLRYLSWRHGRYLLGFADVEEIIDETWCRVLGRLDDGRFDTAVPFRLWLRGICLNVMKDKRLRPSGRHLNQDPPDPGDPPDEAVEREEEVLALRECLAELGEADRKLFEWYYVEERTMVEIARELGCSEANVRQNLLPRLTRALAACLRRKGWSAE